MDAAISPILLRVFFFRPALKYCDQRYLQPIINTRPTADLFNLIFISTSRNFLRLSGDQRSQVLISEVSFSVE